MKKIEKKIQVYITPDDGQGVRALAEEVSSMLASDDAIDEIFINLPDGGIIKTEGVTTSEIRDSICKKYNGTKF